ncbi:calcium homeostasis modulator protein 4-like [Mobula hypostoma]|uniref:calcium homeostasis modulator protein 4-like n=1 Tax=Mobula hypostoma TaxID=723540 RepID=UPI002FC321B1
MVLSTLLSFLESKRTTILVTLTSLATVAGQQAFSFFAFKCPCKPTMNLYYGVAFSTVPALVLLIIGFSINSLTWKLIMSLRKGSSLLHKNCKLICYVLVSIILTSLVAPVTWIAVTLLNGLYYNCAMSEFLPVDSWNVFENMSLHNRKIILARFPCPKVKITGIKNINDLRTEGNNILLFQSQVAGWILIACVTIAAFLTICIPRFCSPLSFLHLSYWAQYIENENTLFQETSKKHSRLFALKHIKKFFGFTSKEKEIKKICLPARKDWSMVSGIDMFTKVEDEFCQYSLLHTWADESTPSGQYISVDDVVA